MRGHGIRVLHRLDRVGLGRIWRTSSSCENRWRIAFSCAKRGSEERQGRVASRRAGRPVPRASGAGRWRHGVVEAASPASRSSTTPRCRRATPQDRSGPVAHPASGAVPRSQSLRRGSLRHRRTEAGQVPQRVVEVVSRERREREVLANVRRAADQSYVNVTVVASGPSPRGRSATSTRRS